MKESPILFSTPMVQAILNGNKTVTRRIVKPAKGYQSKWATIETLAKCPTCYLANVNNELGAQFQHPHAGTTYNGVRVPNDSPYGWFKSPYGKVGDLLWVRETWTKTKSGFIMFKSHHNENDKDIKWKPSIHMKKEYARIWLKITDIRVERLQSITEDDAKAEGVESKFKKYKEDKEEGAIVYKNYSDNSIYFDPKSSFRSLWVKINGKDSWNKNPWVWVIEFEKATN